jgi:hypothetical protein
MCKVNIPHRSYRVLGMGRSWRFLLLLTTHSLPRLGRDFIGYRLFGFIFEDQSIEVSC